MMTCKTKKKNRWVCRKKTGSVLVLIIFVVLISLIIGTGLLALGTQTRVETLGKIQDIMAHSAADAGMEYAIQQINNTVKDGTWSPSVLPNAVNTPLSESDSTYSVMTQYSATTGYTVQSAGTNRNRTRNIAATLRLKGLFDMAIQCREGVVLKGGTVIEAIDSDISLDPDDTDEKAIIGTNSINAGSIVLNNNVKIDGDVVVGVGGDVGTVIKDLGASTLDRYSLSADVEFPTVEPPAFVGPDTLIEVKIGEKTIGGGGDYPASGRFSGLKLKNDCILRVIDNCVLYITGDVNMSNSSEIIVDTTGNASLVIYLDGSWISDNSSGVTNTTQSSSAFQLFGTGGVGQIIDLKAKGDMFGSVYAPNAILTVFSGGDLYGAFVADSFELKNPARFYYDVALKDASVLDEGAHYVISRWNEK
ncbi:MAG: hypothetical protein ISS71_04565 [Phycisphaerae bacterium]|nr:hypothetical protein [Phycisphaerae bacterium]